MTADPVTEVNEETRAIVLRAIHDAIAEGIEPGDFGAAMKAALDDSGAFDAERIEIEPEPAKANDAEALTAVIRSLAAPPVVNVEAPPAPVVNVPPPVVNIDTTPFADALRELKAAIVYQKPTRKRLIRDEETGRIIGLEEE